MKWKYYQERDVSEGVEFTRRGPLKKEARRLRGEGWYEIKSGQKKVDQANRIEPGDQDWKKFLLVPWAFSEYSSEELAKGLAWICSGITARIIWGYIVQDSAFCSPGLECIAAGIIGVGALHTLLVFKK